MKELGSLNFIKQHENIKTSIEEGIKAQFPIEGSKHRLELTDVWIVDDDSINTNFRNFEKQKEIKLNRKSWTIPAYADIKLINKSTGETVDTVKKIKIADIPKLTDRFSVIVDGNEYQTTNQFRLKTGIYTRLKNNGEVESQFNLDPGFNFKMTLDPTSLVFYLNAGNRKYHVYNILHHLFGISENDLVAAWGKKIYEANIKYSSGKEQTEIKDLYSKVSKDRVDFEQAKVSLIAYFKRTGVSPETTELTLGESFSTVDGQTLLATSKKLLKVMRGDEPADERDSMVFKELYTVDDLLEQFFLKRGKELKKKLSYRVDSKQSVRDIINSKTYGDPIKEFFTRSDLVSPPPQTNPVDIVDEWRKTTITGTGGVTSEHAITMDVRNVHPSTLGFLDAVRTPESGRVGVTLGLSVGAEKYKEGITTLVLDKSGNLVRLTPIKFHKSYVGFSDEYTKVNNKPVAKNSVVRGIYQGKTDIYPAEKIQYYIPFGSSMFTISTNMIPFLAHDQGNRAMMGSRMMGQALSIVDREAPNVRVKRQEESEQQTFEDIIGNFLNPISEEAGVVTKIDKNFIHVKHKKSGQTKQYGMYDNFPLNQESFLDSTPLVSVGDSVKANQVLAENNFNRDGHLALGKNVNVAYMPWHGYNFEDAAVATESFAKSFSHDIMIKKSQLIAKEGVLNLSKFKAYFPSLIDSDNTQILNEEGIVKEKSIIKPGQVILAYMQKKDPNKDEIALKNLNRTIAQPYRPTPLVWDDDYEGEVIYVRRNGNIIDLYIKVRHPLVVGDKISNKHGGKSIISRIIPDEDAPHTPDGKRIDLMLNPHGVPGRINAGQILENAAGKLVQATGKPYIVTNFDGTDHIENLKKEYAKNGLEFDEVLLDGRDGKPFKNKVFVGNQYIMKLKHTVDHKMKARSAGAGSGGYDYNEQPSRGETGGQSLDAMQMYALVAHGAKRNLYEMSSIKGQKNDEFWRALQLGLPLPPPNKNFAFEKMINMLKGAGVDVEKRGDTFKLLPMTDEKVLELSSGALDPEKAAYMLRGKDLRPEKGGLFDEKLTGGHNGTKWSHIDLSFKIPNPLFEDAISKVLGLTKPQFNALVKEKDGPQKLETALMAIDIDKELEITSEQLKNAPDSKVNVLNKKYRYLLALKEVGITPDKAYMMSKVPIIPPKFRPIYPLPSGDLMTSPINKHYKDVALIANALNQDKELKNVKGVSEGTEALYKSIKAMQGFTDPIMYTQEKYEGIAATLAGSQPKEGFIQNRLWSKKQDLSGRSTITLEPSLGIDQVGIPETMAKTIYKPFVIRKLVQMGSPAVQAMKEYNDWTPRASRALDIVMEERPVILNRAPTLHKHGVQAFHPVKTTGKSIKLNPLIVSGYNADFDGDCVNDYITITYKFQKSKLKEFGLSSIYDLTVEHLMNILYGETWNLTHNHLIDMFKDVLVTIQNEEEAIFDIHIKDFPYIADSKEISPKGNEAYKVPEGISVFAYKDGKVQLMPVSHWSIHKNLESVEVTTLSKRKTVCSKDHSLFTYNPATSSLEKSTPAESVGRLSPVPKSFNIETKDDTSFDDGYFLGLIVGDGWVNLGGDEGPHKNAIMLASIHDPLIDWISSYLNKKPSVVSNNHDYDGYECNSKKATWHDGETVQTKLAKQHIGHGAKNKHLPYDFLTKSRDYRLGLLSGLIDTDGTVNISNAKANPQYLASYTTASNELKYQVQQLLASLGIRSSATSYERKRNTYHIVSISMVDLISIRDELKLLVPRKAETLSQASVTKDDRNVIPIPFDLVEKLQKAVPFKTEKSLYSILTKSKKTGIIGRESAMKIYNLVNKSNFEDHRNWVKEVLLNNYITWDKIIKVEPTGFTETLWDLTVPDTWTFMTSNLMIVWDTMSVHVPIMPEAVEEAKNMVPSKVIFKHGDNAVVPQIAMEYMLGLYYLTKDGKDTNRMFNSLEEAKKAKLEDQDLFTLVGVGKTSIGKIIFNEVLPKPLRDYSIVLDKSKLNKILTKVANSYSEDFADVMNSLRDIGNQYSHEWGASISLTDLDVDRTFRDKVVLETAKKLKGIDDPKIRAEEWSKAKALIKDDMYKKLREKGNRIQDMLDAGSVKKHEQATQLVMFPGLFEDVKGNILPTPFVKSYAEGFNTFDYWNSMYGVRKGAINTAVNTQATGALNKELLGVTKGLVITEEDCETTKGINIDVNSKDVLDRYLAKDYPEIGDRDTIVDNTIIVKARDKKIKELYVRSPLTCESFNGICIKCYGLMPDGKLADIGDNVGIADSQAITERATQLTLQTRHTGGAAGAQGAPAASFPRLRQLFDVPKSIPYQATVVKDSGIVKNVIKAAAGGYEVYIDAGPGENIKYMIKPGLMPTVSKGDSVQVGDIISTGNARPQDIAETKGHLEAQKYIVNEMNDIYGDSYFKKTFETVVRGISNNAVITKAPEDSGFIRGDVSTIQYIDKINKDRKQEGLKPITYKPKYVSITQAPNFEDDWLSRLTTRYLKSTIKDGVAKGMVSNIHSTDPMPGYIYGQEFGRKGEFY